MESSNRPWGFFKVLYEYPNYKVKLLHVNPHSRLSLQSHAQRQEHWIIESGTGQAVIDDKVIELKKNMYCFIDKGQKHRLINSTSEPLQILEIQMGDYLGEDDICRYEDDYGRENK